MRRLLIVGAFIFLMSCRSSKIIPPISSAPPSYSLIYIIHADANYLYHSKDGQALQADKQVLQTAKAVARQAKHGEVFIFHQKPEHKILWLFPKKDRHFFYYRDGNLVHQNNYSPRSSTQSFTAEATLYHKYTQHKASAGTHKMFLYFGHEVPERPTYPYYHSRPNAHFDTNIFAQGVQSFITSDKSPFELIVLSTCNNGTPSMVQALTPYTRYLLASPQNLHLSHIDTDRLATLLERQNVNIPQIADSLAMHTYQRLSSFLQTAITLSVYDISKTATYIPDLARLYNAYLQKISSESLLEDNSDCSQLPFFHTSEDTLGVTRWYRAPKFGRKRNVTTPYSGWGCK